MGSLTITFYLAILCLVAFFGAAKGPIALLVACMIGGIFVALSFAIAEFVRTPHTRES